MDAVLQDNNEEILDEDLLTEDEELDTTDDEVDPYADDDDDEDQFEPMDQYNYEDWN